MPFYIRLFRYIRLSECVLFASHLQNLKQTERILFPIHRPFRKTVLPAVTLVLSCRFVLSFCFVLSSHTTIHECISFCFVLCWLFRVSQNYIYIYICIHALWYVSFCFVLSSHTTIHECICIYVCISIYIYTSINIFIYIYVYVYIYIYVYIYVYLSIHTYLYSYL